MDEIVVRIARAIACVARLRILSHLVRTGETAPTAMAKELRMPLNVLSTHLKLLSGVGLLCRRRSGVWHHCKAESPYTESALSGAVMSWLREALRTPARTLKHCRLREVCNAEPTQAERALHDVVFDAATAFTNVRRIQILRRLASRDAVTARTLSQELSMSEAAVCRHTSKLARRGYVDAGPAGRGLAYTLAPKFKTPVHERLFDIVRSQWERG